MRDLHNHLSIQRSISPVIITNNTAQVGEIIDLQGFGSLEYVILTGTLGDANATFTVSVEHGDEPDLSDAIAVPDTEFLGSEADASFDSDADNVTRKIGYVGTRRYNRLTITPADNSGNAPVTAIALLGHAAQQPAV